MLPINDIVMPRRMSATECEMILATRLMSNLDETGHPFHHKTANGVIVEPDPTLEYFLSRLAPEKQETTQQEWQSRTKSDAAKAIPVNRRYYGHDPYKLD